MTLSNRHPRGLYIAFILIALILLPFQVSAKKRHQESSRAKVGKKGSTRPERGRKESARDRRRNNRNDRLSARELRRGGSAKLSRRELRRDRQQSAREQTASLKALERRLH